MRTPPIAEKIDSKQSFHGTSLHDPYSWLRDKNYPEVNDERILSYLREENRYYEEFFSNKKEKTDELYNELIARIKQDDSCVPYQIGPYLYHWKFEEGEQYRRWYRAKEGGEEAKVILDECALAEGLEFFRLGGMSICPQHRLMAWSSDTDGSERYTIRVRDLESGEELADVVSNTSGGITWVEEGRSFLYVLLSEDHRPFRVLLHTLGSDTSDDVTIYEEKDPSYFVGVSKSLSRRFVFIGAGDHESSETRVLDVDMPREQARLVSPRRTGHEYDILDAGSHFLIRTNDTHRNFRIVSCSHEELSEETWKELVAPSDRVYITAAACFDGFFVLEERIDGQEQIRVQDAQGNQHHLSFPEPSFSTGLGANFEFSTETLRIHYESMVTPASVFDYDLGDRSFQLLKEQEIPSGYDKSKYRCERLMAPAAEGVEVPISVVYRRDLYAEDRKPQPLHLYAYGAYGMGMSPSFSASRLSLLDRGMAYAIAHVRGGDELGYHWYEDAKREKRKNTFHDFVACAEYLIAEGYAEAGKISISGGSAGGTLMGVAANWRPDLWKAIVANVPFVDVLNTMLDAKLPLTPLEWPEWGNPITDKDAFEYILSYSPYENLCSGELPAIMVTAGLNDPRVTYWEPAKWVAKMRELKTNDTPLLFKTNMGAGHGGKSGRFESYRELAEQYAFLLSTFALL